MPTPRSGINDETVFSRYGFMEAAVPPDPGKSWSALSIPCPECQAETGSYCPGERFCVGRMARLRELMNSGELKATPISTRPRNCPDCRRKRNQNNTKWVACSDDHRCKSPDRGRRCIAAIVPGRDKCPQHLMINGSV
jgi:hypothetical protein